MIIFRVLADLMKSHFIPKFLSDLDRESFIHRTLGPAPLSDKSYIESTGRSKLGNHQLSDICPIPPRKLWDSNSDLNKMLQDHVSFPNLGFISKSLKSLVRQIELFDLKKHLTYMT